jgi:two-component system, cell cycle sensor histidine kinase and response regulator CckA
MGNKPLRVLHVEDSERDFVLLTRHLLRAGYEVVSERVETAETMRAALETREWDAILCDYSLPQFNALAAVTLLKELEVDLPFIIISGTVGEAAAVEAMRAGAHDYLMKDNLVRLAPTIERELHEAENRRARRRAEEALKASEGKMRALFAAMSDVILVLDHNGRYLKIAPSNPAHFYKPVADRVGKTVYEIFPHEQADLFLECIRRALKEERTQRLEYTLSIEGKEIWFEGSVSPLTSDSVIWIARDITERKEAEDNKAQLTAQIESQRRRLNNIVASVPGVVWEAWGDPDAATQRIDFVSDFVQTMLGYTVEEWLSTPNFWLAVVHPDDRAKAARTAAENFAGGKSSNTQEFRWIARDGRVLCVQSISAVVTDHDGKPLGVRGVTIDVTERKRAEEMILRRAVQASLRADVNAALAASDSTLGRILERCTEAMVQHLDTAFAGIWTLKKDDDVLELQSSASVCTQVEGLDERDPARAFKIGLIAKQRRPYIINQVRADPEFSNREWAKREKVVAFAGYPLIVEDKLVGVMAMFTRHKLAEDTLEALASVADIISQGIVRKRAEGALLASEEQLRQSQKLEAVGQLAGGVAHDFNNLLTVINGYCDLLLRGFERGSPPRLKVEEIRKAGERAASLTRQLLAFSRKQVLQPKLLKLNSIVSDIDKMLRRLIGEDIDLLTVLEPSLGHIKADPGQVEQVILNLAVNARDAMPQGGKLTIETSNVHLDEEYARKHTSIRPGHFVMLAVSDNGTGMDATTQAHLFEPFFTTKPQGKGTGLGLSTVYGIVKQSDGNIWVYSERGLGTTFKVYLPRVDEVAKVETASGPLGELPRGRETVLLTEDEEPVRRLTRVILEMNGYQVLEAASGDEALILYEAHTGEVDLILTDVVMPRMSGRELAQQLEILSPGIKVLYLSGYTDDAIVRHGLLDQKMAFLQKPFTPDGLLRKVRAVLDQHEGALG